MENSEAASISEVEYEDLVEDISPTAGLLDTNIELINNVKVNLEIFVGRSEITVGRMFDLKEGAVVTLDKDISSPIEIKLDGKVIASGSLVAVDDKFGVKITHINTSD